MALSRNLLKGMGLTEEQVSTIIEEHMEVVNALKSKATDYEKQIDELNKAVKNNGEADSEYKAKYEKEHSDFEAYKANQAKQGELSKKKVAYEELLRQAGVKEKAISKIVALQNMDEVKMGKDGKIENSDDLSKSIKKDWSEFITEKSVKGAKIENPPANNGGKAMTREQIMAIKDREQRRQAIKDNPEAFGIGNK